MSSSGSIAGIGPKLASRKNSSSKLGVVISLNSLYTAVALRKSEPDAGESEALWCCECTEGVVGSVEFPLRLIN